MSKFLNKSINYQSESEKMLKMAKELFPLNRSLIGPDIRNSFQYFINDNPEFKYIKFRTGNSVFDWQIPEEWIINDAYIEHESGKRYAEFSKNNLHLIGYSKPVDKFLSKEELLPKLHTLPDFPNAIPYLTSYYKKDWGFCLKHNDFETLPDGKYRIFIDSEYKAGKLCLIEAVIPGKSKEEIFFSSYLCHPSLANNELSGPVLLNQILSKIKTIKNRHYTYRFVLLPETIGSIAYLSKRIGTLKSNMICGFNLTCVGDQRAYSHIFSRKGDSIADDALSSALLNLDNVIEYSFLQRGSDERQYCAPGIDLPLCTFCRSRFGKYPEYHTSEDNFNVLTAKGLEGSYKVLLNIIEAFEIGIFPKIKVLGEPQLGKRNLYPNLFDGGNSERLRMNVIAYSDSKNSIFKIAKIIGANLSLVLDEILILKENNLVDLNHK